MMRQTAAKYLYNTRQQLSISTNNIATGMVRGGRKIRFRPPKVRFRPTASRPSLSTIRTSLAVSANKRQSSQ
jgi:hypothetical protein